MKRRSAAAKGMPDTALDTGVRPRLGATDTMTFASLFVIGMFAVVPALAKTETPVLSPSGYGLVQFGQPLESAEKNMGEAALPKKRESACDFVKFGKYPRIRFMVEEGIVTRADATAGIRNSAKVDVGSSFARVKAMHPGIRIMPHKYDDKGHYLVLDSSDGSAAVLFEESGGKVTNVRAGKKPSVEYVEGCR